MTGTRSMLLQTAAIALLFAAPLPAQVSTFDLSGVVLDETGTPLSGATLTIENEETGLVRLTTTGASGRYAFVGLSAGTYFLEVSFRGYATSRYAGLHYFADTKAVFNVTLQPRTIQQSMTFTGEAPLINASLSQIGLSVDERQQAELPLADRDYLDLTPLAAGVTDASLAVPGSSVPAAKSININGAYARYTAYQLDGFDNTRHEHGVAKVDLALDAVDQFRVITNQFSAEYGDSMAGIVSAVTKPGGNTFHGTVFAFVRPGGLDADDPLSGEDIALDRQEVGFALSGPIQRDRTQFFTSFEYRDQDKDAVVTAPIEGGRHRGAFNLPSSHTRFLGKVTHRWADGGRFEGKVVASNADSVDGVGGLDVFQNRQDTRSEDVAAYGTVTLLLGASAINELRLGYTSENYASEAASPEGGVVLIYPTLGILGNPLRSLVANEDAWLVSNTLTISGGRHQLKMGFHFSAIDVTSRTVSFAEGAYVFSPRALTAFDPTDPTTHPILYQQGFFSEGALSLLGRDENHIQVFFQDDWQWSPHTTLSVGLRWEKESSVPDDNNVSPRLGFSWDPTRDGRTLIRAGYGIFVSRVFGSIDTLEGFSGPPGYGVAVLTPGDPLFPVFPQTLPGSLLSHGAVPARNGYLSAPEFAPERRRNPYAHQLTVGIERQLAPSLSLGADVTYIRGENLILPVDVNAPAAFDYGSGLVRSSAAADRTRPFGVPGGAIQAGASPFVTRSFPFQGYRDLYLLDARGRSRYWAMKLNLTRRYATDFMLQLVYTWSRARNDGDDFRPESSLPSTPGGFEAEWGRSATDIPHALTVNGIWDGPWDLRLSGVLRARSGHTVDPRVGEDRDGDGKLRERAFSDGRILERNSFRAPAVATVDLAVSKIFELPPAFSIEARLDVFNLANRLNPTEVLTSHGADARSPLPSFLQVVSAGPPRQFQLSLRLRF